MYVLPIVTIASAIRARPVLPLQVNSGINIRSNNQRSQNKILLTNGRRYCCHTGASYGHCETKIIQSVEIKFFTRIQLYSVLRQLINEEIRAELVIYD